VNEYPASDVARRTARVDAKPFGYDSVVLATASPGTAQVRGTDGLPSPQSHERPLQGFSLQGLFHVSPWIGKIQGFLILKPS
jgi:hypothetical protein